MHLFLSLFYSLSKTPPILSCLFISPFQHSPHHSHFNQTQKQEEEKNRVLKRKKKKNKCISMEVALELELDDDVFFADITKQINLLITDEDDHYNPVSLSSSLSLQGLYRGNYQESRTPYMMYQDQSYNNIREMSSKGTGVFIPRCSQPRKRNQQKKQVRFGSLNPNYKQQFPQYHVNDNNLTTTTTTPLPLASYNNNNGQSLITLHDHFPNPRRSYRDAASIFT